MSPTGEGLTYDPEFTTLGLTPAHLASHCTTEVYLPKMPSYYNMEGYWCAPCGRVTCRKRWEAWQCDSCNVRLSPV